MGRGSALRAPSVWPAASASRRLAQAWASGRAKSFTDSLPTVARTRAISPVCGRRSVSSSHPMPSSSHATCLSAVAMFWPISTRGSSNS